MAKPFIVRVWKEWKVELLFIKTSWGVCNLRRWWTGCSILWVGLIKVLVDARKVIAATITLLDFLEALLHFLHWMTQDLFLECFIDQNKSVRDKIWWLVICNNMKTNFITFLLQVDIFLIFIVRDFIFKSVFCAWE